jgi:hypothetical protein
VESGAPGRARRGRLGPYGIDALAAHGFGLSSSDRAWRTPWTLPAVLRPLRKLAALHPELSGLRDTLASRREVRTADIALGIFADRDVRRLRPRPFAAALSERTDGGSGGDGDGQAARPH